MKVAIYVRVSTDKQEVDNQLNILRPFCEKSGWEIYKEYEDIICGAELSRPGFDLMFKDAHKKLFDVVLFWSYDRFTRAGTLYTLNKLHELDLLGIGYKSYTEQYIDSVGMFKDAIISILAIIAKAEREKISARTKAGLKCQCGHSRALHDNIGICNKCNCQKFHGTGKRGKDQKKRNRSGYFKKRVV